jgi:type IX secretion system PorP/SprF family membrane protein
MKKLISFMLVVSAGCFAPDAAAQDIHFSQMAELPMHLNPAATGMFDGLFRLTTNYKSQWASMGSPYRTMAAAFDMPFRPAANRAYLGLGLFLFRDQAGDSKFGTFQGSISGSAIVPLSKRQKFSAGVQFGMGQRSATITGLQWESQYINGTYDPTAPTNEANLLTSFLYPDISAGVVYQYRNVAGNLVGKDVVEFQGGFSVFHANQPAMRFHGGGGDKLPMRIVAHAQLRYDFPDTRWSLRPSASYMQQAAARQIIVGSMFRFRIKDGTKFTNYYSESGIGAGLHYRFGDALIPQFYYDLGDFFIGMSYDFNISKYTAVSRGQGGFEITLRYANLNGALYKNKK